MPQCSKKVLDKRYKGVYNGYKGAYNRYNKRLIRCDRTEVIPMKHSIQLKREDTSEVLVISSQICGDTKRSFFAVLEKEPEIKCREIPITVYDHEENEWRC